MKSSEIDQFEKTLYDLILLISVQGTITRPSSSPRRPTSRTRPSTISSRLATITGLVRSTNKTINDNLIQRSGLSEVKNHNQTLFCNHFLHESFIAISYFLTKPKNGFLYFCFQKWWWLGPTTLFWWVTSVRLEKISTFLQFNGVSFNLIFFHWLWPHFIRNISLSTAQWSQDQYNLLWLSFWPHLIANISLLFCPIPTVLTIFHASFI